GLEPFRRQRKRESRPAGGLFRPGFDTVSGGFAVQLTEQYRPRIWEDVCGQDEVIATINTLRKRGLGGRAYVLTGKSGTGKSSIAKLIAAEVAGPLATQEENAKDVTISYIRQMEDEMRTRVLPSDEGGKTGRAWT